MAQPHPAASWQIRLKESVLRRWKPIARRVRPEKADAFQLSASISSALEPFTFALFQSLGVRIEPGHQLMCCDNGRVFDAIADEIARARTSIHVVLYIWEKGQASDRVTAALIERAKAGVACRILVDAFGSSAFEDDIAPSLIDAGCEVRIFRPLPGKDKLARNHRKVMVFDGATALTGGFGIRDNWLGDGVHNGSWRDTNICFSGPAVAQAQQAFAENWQEAGGELLPRDAFPLYEPKGSASAVFVSSTGSVVTRAERLTQLLIAAARERLWIANAYFVPSRGIVNLLCQKAREGVNVRILAPGKTSDSKTSFTMQHVEYRSMLRCGVRIWEYLPSMMHAKTMLVDDAISLVGSINLDPLSLSKLDEGALVTVDAALAAALAEAFVADCGNASELGPRHAP